MHNGYLDNINKKREIEVSKIKKLNDYTNIYGLKLTDIEICNIIEKRNEVLKNTNRIEFRESIVEKIIQAFCDSPYMYSQTYVHVISELVEIFYVYKNETLDIITDNELIEFMKESFNGICHGDLEYLSGTILYKMKNNVINGKPMDYGLKEEENYGEY